MASATARIQSKKQTLDDAYAPPANFLEIDVVNSETHGIGKKRYTDYEVRMKVIEIRCAAVLYPKHFNIRIVLRFTWNTTIELAWDLMLSKLDYIVLQKLKCVDILKPTYARSSM